MQNFAELKKSRQNSINQLREKVEKIATGGTEIGPDERFWRAEVDKAGNGYAIIRFLPPPAGEDIPWARTWNHGFQGVGGWYIEDCPTTINKKCPLCEYNGELWNSGIEANKEIVRKQKRRLSYISNILVVKDPANPDNEGKVFLFKYGKKIFDKVNEAMNPAFEDEQPVNPFDFWEGANFRLKIRKVEGYTNYDKSEFDSSAPLFDGDDERLEALWKAEYSLSEFVDETKFKSYEDLKSRLDRVLGVSNNTPAPQTKSIEEDNVYSDAPFSGGTKVEETTSSSNYSSNSETEEDDVDLSYFAKLAQE